jgi:hypothetical protein
MAEKDDQKALAELLDTIRLNGRPLLWCHVPNEGKRNKLYAVELKRRGVKAGVPDVLIFDPPPKCPQRYRGIALELKRTSGGKESDDQRFWRQGLQDRGWGATICYGIDDAIECLKELGYLRPTGVG